MNKIDFMYKYKDMLTKVFKYTEVPMDDMIELSRIAKLDKVRDMLTHSRMIGYAYGYTDSNIFHSRQILGKALIDMVRDNTKLVYLHTEDSVREYEFIVNNYNSNLEILSLALDYVYMLSEKYKIIIISYGIANPDAYKIMPKNYFVTKACIFDYVFDYLEARENIEKLFELEEFLNEVIRDIQNT